MGWYDRSQSAELDAVAPESVDTFVFTYALCTVPDPARVHAAQSPRDASFELDSIDEHYVDDAPRFAGFHQIGQASKPMIART